MNLRTATAALLIALLPSSLMAQDQSFSSEGGQISFASPSGNIGCSYFPAGGPVLQCDRLEPSHDRFLLRSGGGVEPVGEVSDGGCCSTGNVLAYGNTWREGPFNCRSERTGMTCRRDDGAGFFLSRLKVTIF